MLAVSDDGYIRLAASAVQEVTLTHLVSGLDEAPQPGTDGGATATAITGYTEWISPCYPLVSVGWDWQMSGQHSTTCLRRVGDPRSNLMLQQCRADMGTALSHALLGNYIDALHWQAAALRHIRERYGANCRD